MVLALTLAALGEFSSGNSDNGVVIDLDGEEDRDTVHPGPGLEE
jgi:hypothetical protein